MLQIFKKENKGFTLMELIVSISIITILIGVFLVNYRGSSKRTELIMASQKMVTDIRLAQNNTLGSVKYNNQIPLGGWGVHFDIDFSGDNKSYLIFADINGNAEYDPDTEDDTSFGARTIYLPDKININSIDLGNTIDITFLPPDPVTVINDGISTSSKEVNITLQEEWNNSTKDININSFGLIEVVD